MDTTPQRLQRSLHSRHVSMIAIGGTIGAGLFITSGAAISESGPGGTLLAYAVMSLVVFTIMTALTEMAAHLSLEGAFKAYPRRFVDPALGFTNGWCWWIGGSMTLAAELVGSGIIIKFWFPGSSTALWAVGLLSFMLVLNLFSVKNFGESTYWLASIKVLVIIGFILIGIGLICGVIDGHQTGFSNWTFSGGTAGQAPFVNGATGVCMSFLVAGFSFSNIELIGVSAAESKSPGKDLPKAMYTVFFTIVFLYLGTLAIVGTLLPFTNDNLLHGGLDNIAHSPFAIIFTSAGFSMAASMMNLVILSALLTCGNSTLYSVSRLLCNMAETGDAPKFLATIDRRGVPARAVVITALFGGVAFLTSFIGDGALYTLCYYVVGLSAFMNWFCLLLSHYRFRKAFLLQGHRLDELRYVSPFYPYSDVFGLVLCVFLLIGSNYWMFLKPFTWYNFISCYGLIPIALVLFFGYKLRHKTTLVPLSECSFAPEKD